MFGIFDNIAEITFIFKGESLVYANNSACFYLKSYEKNLIGKRFGEIFEEKDIKSIADGCSGDGKNKIKLTLKNGRKEAFRIRAVEEYEGEFLILQSDSVIKGDRDEYNFNRIIAPRAVYDPISAGLLNILNYEIADNYMKVHEELKKLDKAPCTSAVAREISSLISNMISEFKSFAGELIDADIKYLMLNRAFALNHLLSRIALRMNDAYKMENIAAEVIYEAPTGADAVVFGDYMKIGSSVITLITVLVKANLRKNKKSKIELKLTRDEDNCYISICSKNTIINKETYDAIINEGTEIINLNRYKTDKLVLNVHVVSAYIELNNGELSVRRERNKGTEISVKFPIVKRKFTLKEINLLTKDSYVDKFISKIIYFLLNNV